jgi:asparagine synthase (glutamine-hydrolysing)
MKVVLSADGGDELFGGYTHYQKTLKLWNRFRVLPIGMRSAVARSAEVLFPPVFRKKISLLNLEHKAYAFEEIIQAENPTQFFEAIIANQTHAEINQILEGKGSLTMNTRGNGKTALQEMMDWDFHHFLPDDLLVKVDRATMFYGVECREPFLDHRLVEFAATMPDHFKIKNGKGKYLLREILKKYVPENLYERKKQGFSIPVFAWFQKELDQMFYDHFSDQALQRVPFLNAQEIQREHKKYLQYKKGGKEYNIEKLWRILSFMLWWERYMA